MAFDEEDWLQLSGLQHFAFCRRQWALIHIESQWAENYRTVDGQLMHEQVHDPEHRESRGDRLTVRGLAIHSAELGVSGQCDAVEFFRDPAGVPLQGREGLWLPYPVEYKRGKPREQDADKLQLCAQAMCLEEMLCCAVPEGALYYGEPRRRTVVQFTDGLRRQVRDSLAEMHELYKRRHTPRSLLNISASADASHPASGCNEEKRRNTLCISSFDEAADPAGCRSRRGRRDVKQAPKVKPTKACNACSLKDLCLPRLMSRKKVADYLAAAMEETE